MKPHVLAVGQGSTSVLTRLSNDEINARFLNLRVGATDPVVTDASPVTGSYEPSTAEEVGAWDRLLGEVTKQLETDCLVAIAGLNYSFSFDRFVELLRTIQDDNRLLLTFYCWYPEERRGLDRTALNGQGEIASLSDFWLGVGSGITGNLAKFSSRFTSTENRLNRAVSEVTGRLIHRVNTASNLTGELEELLGMSSDQKREFLTNSCPWLC